MSSSSDEKKAAAAPTKEESKHMYQLDNDEAKEESSSTSTSLDESDEVDQETVKTAAAAKEVTGEIHLNLLAEVNPSSTDSSVSHPIEGEDYITNERDDLEDEEADKYFDDIFPQLCQQAERDRLDTVEEVTEPASSEYCGDSLPMDMDAARMGSSGQASSEFQNDSLPPDHTICGGVGSAKTSMTMSITSREEMFSVSEIEVCAAMWPNANIQKTSTASLPQDHKDDKEDCDIDYTPPPPKLQQGLLSVFDPIAARTAAEISVDENVSGDKTSGESDDNSLSISLPSEGGQRQLAQVRSGILKLLSTDDEDDSFDNKSGAGTRANVYMVDGGTDDDLNDVSSATDDNLLQLRFSEKHEFEDDEKKVEMSQSKSTWSEGDEAVTTTTNTAADNDSGIDRDAAASRVSGISATSGNKIWTKIHKQINRRFGGSTGSLSSASPVSEQDRKLYSQEVAQMESPREGGFESSSGGGGGEHHHSVAMMKDHIKQLMAQLAKAEDDKQKIADEAYRRAVLIKEEADAKVEAANQAQNKQASLVDRLQAKVVQYKEQCQTMEKRLLEVNQLANQSQIRLTDTTEVLSSLESRLKTTEDRHFAEVRALQVKLEEQQEKNNTLVQVNHVLRDQLEAATKNNDNLSHDVQKLTDDWDKLNQQLQEKEKAWKRVSQSNTNAEHQKVIRLWREISSFRQQYTHMKMSTERELVTLKNELSNANRKLTSACLDVYTSANYLDVGQNGQPVHVGSQKDLWVQLQRCKAEKKLLDSRANELEDKSRQLNKQVEEMRIALRKSHDDKDDLHKENERLRGGTSDESSRSGTSAKVYQLEEHSAQLETSLFDIAQIVLDDADVQEQEDVVDQAQELTSTSVLVRPTKHRPTSSPARSRPSTSDRRRTRSASPAMMDSTLAAVQAALHRRQLQVHELRTKMSNYTEKMTEMSKLIKSKDESMRLVERKLETERLEADSMKIRLDELMREKLTFQERTELLLVEKSSMGRSKNSLQEELDSLSKEKVILTEEHAKLTHALEAAQSDMDHLEMCNQKLSKDNKDKVNLISQLEKVGSSLREELLATKDELHKTAKALDVLQHEQVQTQQTVSTLESSTVSSHDLTRLQRDEKTMKETIVRLEKSRSSLLASSQKLESTVEKLDQEKVRLTLEVNEQKATVQSLKDQLVSGEHKLGHFSVEKQGLVEQVKTCEEAKDKLELELRKVCGQKEELDNQLVAITLQKDALSDQLVHVQAEMQELKGQMDRVCDQNAALNKQKSELEVRVDQLNKETSRMEEQLAMHRNEQTEQYQEVQDLKHELDNCQVCKKKLEVANQDWQNKHDLVAKQVKVLKTELEEENCKAAAEKERLETEKEEMREKMDKVIKRLRSELSDVEEHEKATKDELKRILEKSHRTEVQKLTAEKVELVEKLQLELTEVTAQLNRLKHTHTEEVLLAENSKQQALLMAQQEQKGMVERLGELTNSLEESRAELERVKRDGQNRIERDRANIADLQLEVSRLRGQVQVQADQLEAEKSNLNEALVKEKQAKLQVLSEVDSGKSTLEAANERLKGVTDQLSDAKRKLRLLGDTKEQQAEQLQECQQKLMEVTQQLDTVQVFKDSLQDSIRLLDKDKLDLTKKLRDANGKVNSFELLLTTTKQEMSVGREDYHSLLGHKEELEERLADWQHQYKTLQSQHRELEMQYDSLKDRILDQDDHKEVFSREAQQLRLTVTELAGQKSALEKEMVALKATSIGEQETNRHKVSSLNMALEDMRARERKLEDQRHNLELCLSAANQEVKELQVKLTGYEGRVSELQATIARLDSAKRDSEARMATVANILQSITRGSESRSRPVTPTTSRRSASGARRSSSPWPIISNGDNNVDIEQIKTNIKDIVGRIGQADRERDEAIHQVVTLKRQNEEMILNTVSLDEQVAKYKHKMNSTEEQLRKLEHKVSVSDVNLASQDEELQKRERELKQLSARLAATSQQLEEFQRSGTSTDDEGRRLRQIEAKLENEKRLLQSDLRESESQCARLEVSKKSLEGENQRLQVALGEKEADVKALKSKCESLGRGVSTLEDKCTALSTTVDHLNSQLERSCKSETELQSRVSELSRTLNATSSSSHGIQDQAAHLERSLSAAENDKRMLEERLESSRQFANDLKRTQESLQDKLAQVQADLQRSESRANQSELALQASRASLENSAQDNYLREELGRMRRENNNLQERLKELNKKISMLESDKADLEARSKSRNVTSSVVSPGFGSTDQVDYVRTQIPLMGGRSPVSPHHHHHHHGHHHQCGEHVVKIRLMEQENERFLRKIRGLEHQLSELESIHGARVQELLQERRRERDKENQRQKEALRQMEASLAAREKIFKERITGLEEQVDVLKDQLAKEMRRRQLFISESSGISNEISELRHNLDQSLYNVSSTADGRTLDRETGRLNMSVDRYGPDYTSRLTPSKLGESHRTVSTSVDNLHRFDHHRTTTSTPGSSNVRVKRTLHFGNDT